MLQNAAVYIIFAIILYALAENARKSTITWQDTVKMIVSYGTAIFLFWLFHQPLSALANVALATYQTDNGNMYYVVVGMWMILGAAIWFLLNRFLVRPTTWWGKTGTNIAVVEGTLVMSVIYLYQAGRLPEFKELFLGAAAVTFLVSVAIYWFSGAQDHLARPLGLGMAITITAMAYYIGTGINLFYDVRSLHPAHFIPWILLLVFIVFFTFIFGKNKKWDETLGYRITLIYMFILMIYVVGYGIIGTFGGAANKTEWDLKAAANVWYTQIKPEIQLNEEVRQIRVTAAGSVYSATPALALDPNEEYDLAKIKTLLRSPERITPPMIPVIDMFFGVALPKAQKIVGDVPRSQSTLNAEKINGLKKGALQTVDAIESNGGLIKGTLSKVWTLAFGSSSNSQDDDVEEIVDIFVAASLPANANDRSVGKTGLFFDTDDYVVVVPTIDVWYHPSMSEQYRLRAGQAGTITFRTAPGELHLFSRDEGNVSLVIYRN